ncbi:MAG TPA: PIN domain-containing protein [Phycisphaerae bacterium]|nr:PIN domain-containing protein [Phycisphaerae bacterium]
MILHVIRFVFVLAVLAISFSYAVSPDVLAAEGEWSPVTKVLLVVIVPFLLALGLILADIATPNKSLGAIGGLFFGVVAGTILAWLLGMVVELGASVVAPGRVEPDARAQTVTEPVAAGAEGGARTATRPSPDRRGANEAAAEADTAGHRGGLVATVKLLVAAFTIYLCVSLVLQTKDDFRFIIPYVEFAKDQQGVSPMLLDTSVIIDGRIADIAETHVIESELIVPRFVLEEIQAIADSSDKLKRNRGRRGLDMLNRLQSNEKVHVRLTDVHIRSVDEVSGVDQKLVALGEHMKARVVTNDYNLNKIAKLRGVAVININDLANALKPVFLPGESLAVKIIKPGEEIGQGVGYLDDGTMVVAEQGKEYVGREMNIVVTSVLQTSAGRMIFGRPQDGQGPRSRN